VTGHPRLLALSGPAAAQLELATDELAIQLEAMDDAAFAGLPAIPAPEAAPGALRRVIIAGTPVNAARWLRKRDPRRVFTAGPGTRTSRVFLFSGVGDHYQGLGAGLYRCLPAFRGELDRCLRELAGQGLDLRSVLLPAGGAVRSDPAAVFDQRALPQEIHRPVVAQPLLFALQYSLARAMTALGAGPSVLAGYSMGEYSAACVAGVFPFEHALRLVTGRARMVDELPTGAMLTVATGPGKLRRHLDGPLSLAALNGPEQTVLSGPAEAIEEAARQLTEEGVACQRLATSHAFHSAMMEPLTAPLEELLRSVPLHPPAIPLLSGATGTWLRDDQATSPAHWARQLCRTIRFSDEVSEIWRLPGPLLVELGPGQALSRLALGHWRRPVDAAANVVQTLPGRFESRSEWELLLTAAGRLWVAGAPIDWAGLAGGSE
jgi:acyl transferase domain-containing protein